MNPKRMRMRMKLKRIRRKSQRRERSQGFGDRQVSVGGDVLSMSCWSTSGTAYRLSCTQRGTSGVGGQLSLCTSCWVWRKLPATFFPQFINELICDTNDTACLSGDFAFAAVITASQVTVPAALVCELYKL
jgi:hypothetical protein